MENRTAIIIQARTGSTRLPQKMTKIFNSNKSLLEIIVARLSVTGLPIIIGTSTNIADDVIENIAIANGTKVFRGDENDVLKRFIVAAEKFNINKIIRVCADNPLLDVDAITKLYQKFEKSDCDYLCFSTKDGIPTIKTHYGFWSEGVTITALKKIEKNSIDMLYREHVTNFIYSNPELFKIERLFINPEIEEQKLRLTIDTLTDFELMQEIYSQLVQQKIPLNAVEISRFVSENKGWLEIMNREIIKNSK